MQIYLGYLTPTMTIALPAPLLVQAIDNIVMALSDREIRLVSYNWILVVTYNAKRNGMHNLHLIS